MYKSIVLLVFVSTAISAFQSATACGESTSLPPTAKCDEQVANAVASLQNTIQLQAKTIEYLNQQVQSLTTPAPPHIDELLQNSVNTAVGPLQQTIQLQTLTIEGLLKSGMNQTTSTSAALCASQEFVSSTIQSAVIMLQKAIQQQTQAMSAVSAQNSTTLTPAPDTTISTTSAPLPKTIDEQKPRNASCGHDSGYTFYPVTGRCYKLDKKAKSWPAANITCHADGAYLAVINSREEGQVLNDIVVKGHEGWSAGSNWAFIGVYRDYDQVWRTVTGETPEEALTTPGYKPWHKGYPKDEDQKGYGIIVYRLLQNVDNNWKYSSICEKAPEYQ